MKIETNVNELYHAVMRTNKTSDDRLFGEQVGASGLATFIELKKKIASQNQTTGADVREVSGRQLTTAQVQRRAHIQQPIH